MSVQKILIIEDDLGAAEAVFEKVTSAGFEAVVEHTGAKGIAAFKGEHPDLVVLDLMLPDIEGLDICRAIRQTSNVPIIMLTAKAEEVDRIIGLEIGADDYVVKPFSPKELVSRIRAVLRRIGEQPIEKEASVYKAAGLELDEIRHDVRLQGSPLKLTPTEYKILALLMRHAGQVVSRQTLTDAIWGYDGYSPNLLEIHVGNLRRKIEENPRHPKRLITVRSFGYKIAEGPDL